MQRHLHAAYPVNFLLAQLVTATRLRALRAGWDKSVIQQLVTKNDSARNAR